MSPFHSTRNLQINLSKIAAIEISGRPLETSQASILIHYVGNSSEQGHIVHFDDYLQAHREFESLSERWMHYENNKDRLEMIRQVEKELLI